MKIIESLEKRRSYYSINKNTTVSEKEIEENIKKLTKLVPDAFDIKSTRVVILFGEKNDQLWEEIYQGFNGKVAKEKIDTFRAGIGTVLFYYDQTPVKAIQEKFSSYAEGFPFWVNQTNGALQLAVWSMLRELNLGASLQHYATPAIEEKIRQLLNLPESYVLLGQMPFGGIGSEPKPKEKDQTPDRVRVFR